MKPIVPESGPCALLAAMFDRAWKDARSGNGHAEGAWNFLRDPGTIDNLSSLGVDAGYYVRLLDAEARDR